MSKIIVDWNSTYDVKLVGKMCLNVVIEKKVPHCTLGYAINLADVLINIYEHHGLSSLDIIDENTGEVHCTVKKENSDT